ncbi:hypothetical protein FNB79_09465 [Formosa sediminum]|uniref:Outer membrane protein assembly factor BamE n=1 Tax=Formosa sediminum TaxID=2594004 RepID=A0A516GRQ8_9FLAO|nr:hypothetical protein [Formosa sediminum]QDO94196.1 hypothetical protein FNB79_09465 [Formosa sediminum]
MALLFILLLAIPTFFICKWCLKKLDIGTPKNRNYIALCPTFILSPLCYIVIILIWIGSSSYYAKHEFSKLQWNTHPETRYTMTQDIIESEMFIGKTKAEIADVLGSDYYVYNENHISYTLGVLPGLFNIDPQVLDLYFKQGKVVRVSQHES